MVLTNQEKAAIILPVVLAVLIIVVSVYSKQLSSRQQLLHEMIEKTSNEISDTQEQLLTLEDFAETERFQSQYGLDDWIPLFRNTLEVNLFVSQKIQRELRAVGVLQQECTFKIPQSVTTPRIGEFYVQAQFPSFTSLEHFLQTMEETPPPVLPQEVEITKAGITIDTILTFYFGYRLQDETE